MVNLLGIGGGKGKGKDKGKMRTFMVRCWRMNALKKNGGFKKLNAELFDWIFDIDVDSQSLWLVPLAIPPAHNPVYVHKPGQGEFNQILYDLSDSLDGDGIMAIGALELGTIRHRDFICAKVKLSTGEEGWINIAMRSNNWQNDKWFIYMKVVLVEGR